MTEVINKILEPMQPERQQKQNPTTNGSKASAVQEGTSY